MIDNYINNFENIVSSVFLVGFIAILISLTSILILSLIILAIGCLIKSQKIKSKFLKVVPILVITIIFILTLPYLFCIFNN
ncbi:MAG: hypothetical protein HFJ30_00965 [Clostridia bacterium]|jgi:hypothetical protein|nr:hypothetical protein [Clostridia bacterium]